MKEEERGSANLEKRGLLEALKDYLSRKLLGLEESIREAQISRDGDTKSSAGDKHETSRAMAQIEIDNLTVQLSKTQGLMDVLESINVEVRRTEIGLGSLVRTNFGDYFISIGVGLFEYKERAYYVISPQSPIGQLLMSKSEGDEIVFNDKVTKIDMIL